MKKIYPYLKDTDFMYLADTQNLQNQFIKLTLLDWNENPLEEIQGIATGGSISINGNSAIRRTCSLSMTVKDVSTGKITDTKNLISINKKVYIEIGIVNKTNYYKDYDILWYPQGVFVFTQCSINTALGQGISLSAQLKDKMCLLNGECGGVITSAVILDKYDTLDDTTGKIITTQPTISRIIRELVNHFGKEDLSKIIINDIEEQIKMVMRWTGANSLYLATKDSSHLFTTSYNDAEAFGGIIQEFQYGQDVGFIYADFVWTQGDLTANCGDNICSILDKIKNFLGNYEYYYDIDGNFIFQEIRNYLNTTQAAVDLRRMNNNDYVIDISKGKSIYDFSDSKLITSFANNPQYNKIKNDFVVWGIRETPSGAKLPIRYHLSIDSKPQIGNIYEVFFYNDPDDGLTKAKVPIKYENRAHFPEIGVEGLFYLDNITGIIYKWSTDLQTYISVDGCVYQEYNSKSDFPSVGESGVIYVSTSTDRMYNWTIVPGSTHYNSIAAQLTALQTQYQVDIKPYQDAINDDEAEIAVLNATLEELDNSYRKWLVQKRQLENSISQKTNEKTALNNEISTKNLEITHQQTIVLNKTNEILQLQNELDHTIDPVRRQELTAQIEAATLVKDAALQQITLLEGEVATLTDEVDALETEIDALELELVPIEAALTNYYDDKEDIEDAIEAQQDDIADIQEDIDAIDQQYGADRAALLAQQGEYVDYRGASLVYVQTTDWRSELYLSGAAAEPLGLESNYYYPELAAEWPKLYNLQADSYIDDTTGKTIYTGAFYDKVLDNPWDVDYWLDFIDSEAEISQFNISNIGRRSITKNSNDYNCVFESDVPDIVIIESDQPDTEAIREECEARNQDYCQVSSNIYDALTIGGMHNSCFVEVKNMLWENTNYNASINISLIPIYHLEPNTRITVHSNEADIHGDFMIQSMSVPLDIGGTMSISAIQIKNKL